jgi:hypothetical protein
MIVTLYGENGGVEAAYDLTDFPGSLQLRRAFAAALDRKAGPGGTWRSPETCRSGYQDIRIFLRWLHEHDDPPQTPQDITPAVWTRWSMSLPDRPSARQRRRRMRVLMPMLDGLPAETVRAIDRRFPREPPPGEKSYSRQELEQIRSAAAKVFNTALVRIRTNREHLRRWYDGQFSSGSTDWLVGEALDCLVRTGDVPLQATRTRVLLSRYRRALGGVAPELTWGRLYLTRSEARAAAILLVISEGWNRTVLERMEIPSHDPAVADPFDIHMVEIDKRRRPVRLRHTSNNLLDSGPDTPGRLLSQVIEATELARQTLELRGQPTRKLLVFRREWSAGQARLGGFGDGVPRTNSRQGRGEPGQDRLSSISFRRLRRTVQVLVRKEPAQNSQATHDDIYALRDAGDLAETHDTIAQGLTDALDEAKTVVKMRVVLGEDADRLLELADDPELAKAIANGEHDTATGACTDFTNGPVTEPGLPCTASFLLCLACGNAVATRRHLPRLVYLQQALNELRAVVDARVWDQDWREHLLRVDSLLADHTTSAERAAQRELISDTDRMLVDRMLRRKLDA